MIRKLPKDGSIRRKRAFAWLPVITDNGYYLWLEYYTQVERYYLFIEMCATGEGNHRWVAQEYLYEGETDV